MKGIIVWTGMIMVNILVFSLFQRPESWKNIRISKVILSGIVSFFCAYSILAIIEHEYLGEYIMWLPIGMIFCIPINWVSIYAIAKLLYLVSKKFKMNKRALE